MIDEMKQNILLEFGIQQTGKRIGLIWIHDILFELFFEVNQIYLVWFEIFRKKTDLDILLPILQNEIV